MRIDVRHHTQNADDIARIQRSIGVHIVSGDIPGSLLLQPGQQPLDQGGVAGVEAVVGVVVADDVPHKNPRCAVSNRVAGLDRVTGRRRNVQKFEAKIGVQIGWNASCPEAHAGDALRSGGNSRRRQREGRPNFGRGPFQLWLL